jgi:hypothetical protein
MSEDDWDDDNDFDEDEEHVDEDFLYEQMVDREMDSMRDEVAAIALHARSDAEVKNGLSQAVARLLANGRYYKDDAPKLWEHIHGDAFFHVEMRDDNRIAWQSIVDEAATHEFLNKQITARDFK